MRMILSKVIHIQASSLGHCSFQLKHQGATEKAKWLSGCAVLLQDSGSVHSATLEGSQALSPVPGGSGTTGTYTQPCVHPSMYTHHFQMLLKWKLQGSLESHLLLGQTCERSRDDGLFTNGTCTGPPHIAQLSSFYLNSIDTPKILWWCALPSGCFLGLGLTGRVTSAETVSHMVLTILVDTLFHFRALSSQKLKLVHGYTLSF